MCDGRLSRPACFPASNLNPNFVAMTTRSRTGANASPTSSSFATRRLSVTKADAHAAEAERRDLQTVSSQYSLLHDVSLIADATAPAGSGLDGDLRSMLAHGLFPWRQHQDRDDGRDIRRDLIPGRHHRVLRSVDQPGHHELRGAAENGHAQRIDKPEPARSYCGRKRF